MKRLLPIAIVLAAAAAEGSGARALAVYLLLVAVPVGAGCALALFGELLDARARGGVEPAALLEPFLAGLALIVLVAGTAAGSIAGAIVGCLGIYSVQALLGLTTELRRPMPEALER